jgi:O-antigen ligase
MPDKRMLDMRAGHWTDARLVQGIPSLPFVLCAIAMVSSLVLGGGTRSGFLSDAILQFFCIPPLLVSLSQSLRAPPGNRLANSSLKWGLAFCAALVAIPLVQLVPLPPAVWTMLPNRQAVAEAFELVGADLPWMPISVSPEATWLSALSLIPPIAVFLGVQLLTYTERRLMSLVVLSIGLLSVFLGLLQVAQGSSSPLRFFAFTNTSEAVGFFANRNHFAALAYALILVAACWATDAIFKVRAFIKNNEYDTSTIAIAVVSVAIIIVFLSAEAMARSRAGLALTIFALIGAFALAWKEWRLVSRGAARLVAGAIAVTALFIADFTLYRIMERFADDPLANGRITFARNTLKAAVEYLPFGSGMGSFVQVYGMYERPGDTMADTFVNHAHNDILEVSLEAGILGIALMAIFAVWVTKRSVDIWRSSTLGRGNIDLRLARGATLIVVLLSFHSLVDYPLRTAAIMAVMAFACGLLVAPVVEDDKAASLRHENSGKRPFEKRQPHAPVRVAAAPPARSKPAPETARAPWAENITWPEGWRQGPRR